MDPRERNCGKPRVLGVGDGRRGAYSLLRKGIGGLWVHEKKEVYQNWVRVSEARRGKTSHEIWGKRKVCAGNKMGTVGQKTAWLERGRGERGSGRPKETGVFRYLREKRAKKKAGGSGSGCGSKKKNQAYQRRSIP